MNIPPPVRLPERLRTAITRMPAATTMPATSDRVLKRPLPKMSGTKPEAISWKLAGKGPTDWPASSQSVSPLKTSMPASVTMKDGILKKATQKPWAMPISAPTARQISPART